MSQVTKKIDKITTYSYYVYKMMVIIKDSSSMAVPDQTNMTVLDRCLDYLLRDGDQSARIINIT